MQMIPLLVPVLVIAGLWALSEEDDDDEKPARARKPKLAPVDDIDDDDEPAPVAKKAKARPVDDDTEGEPKTRKPPTSKDDDKGG
jgi:hypothetical protein